MCLLPALHPLVLHCVPDLFQGGSLDLWDHYGVRSCICYLSGVQLGRGTYTGCGFHLVNLLSALRGA